MSVAEIASLIERIPKLKRARNALILAHNYQPSEIRRIADHVTDALELSQRANWVYMIHRRD